MEEVGNKGDESWQGEEEQEIRGEAYIFRWTESLKKGLKKGLKKVTELKKNYQKSNEAQKSI